MLQPTTFQRPRIVQEILLVVAGAVLYLGLRSYQSLIAMGQSQAALSLAEWAFGAETKMHSVLFLNLLLDIPFSIMSGVLIAAILMGLKPRSLIWSGVVIALLGEAMWLFIWDTLTGSWILASRMITVLGLIGGCFWLQRFRKCPPPELPARKNALGQS